MGNVIKIKRSATTATPSALAPGELAFSEASDNLFIGKSDSSIEVIGGGGTFAKKSSPAFTGTPTAPTAANGTNTTQLATTAFVTLAVAGKGVGDMQKADYDSNNDGKVNSADSADNALALGGVLAANFAQLNSPAFTGTPSAPTAAVGTNTTQLASTQFVVSEIASRFAANDAMVYMGAIDCSSNPNYPAADAGHTYRISVAGKIGGASGVPVEAGDMLICNTDSSAAGTQAAVGANWNIIQVNLDGAVTISAAQTLVNKTMSGANNTFSNIPNTAITGLGTMSTQAANNVAITGGSISGVNLDSITLDGGTF